MNSADAALILSALLAWLVVTAWAKPTKIPIVGWLIKGKSGFGLSFKPVKGKKKGRKR